MTRPPRIKRLERAGKVDRLVAALSYSDWASSRDGGAFDLGVPVRRDAVAALGELADPGGLAAVASIALADPDDGVRVAAVVALEGRPEESAVAALAACAAAAPDSEHKRSRRAAIGALRRSGAGAAGALAIALIDRPGDEPLNEGLELLRDIAPEALPQEAAVEALIPALATATPPERKRFAEALALFPAVSVPALLRALDDPAMTVPVAETLGALRDTHALDALLGLLQDDDADVRRVAAVALGQLRDARAVGPLLARSTDESFEVRSAAIAALDALGSTAVVAGVLGFLRPLLEDVAREQLDAASADSAAQVRRVLDVLDGSGAQERTLLSG